MNKDFDLSLAALLLAILAAQNGLEAYEALRAADYLSAALNAASAAGCTFLTRAVWRAA